MRAIRSFKLFESLARLGQLGMVPELAFSDWVTELIEKDPELHLTSRSRWDDDSVVFNQEQASLQPHQRAGFVYLAIKRVRHNNGGVSQRITIRQTTFGQGYETNHKEHRTKRVPETTTLEAAQQAVRLVKTILAGGKVQESVEGRQRLIDLGMAEDLPVADWVETLLEGDPDLIMVWHPNDRVFTVKRDSDRAKVLIRPGSQPGFTKEWVKIEYSVADGMRFWVKRREEIIPWEGTNLTMAQKIITRIKAHYATGTNESLTRLARLGMATGVSVADLLVDMLKDHPDFKAELAKQHPRNTEVVWIGRPWAKSNILITVLHRQTDLAGNTQIYRVELRPYFSDGEVSNRYEWTPDEISLGPGTLGIAQGIAQILEDYYSRQDVGIRSQEVAPVPGPLGKSPTNNPNLDENHDEL